MFEEADRARTNPGVCVWTLTREREATWAATSWSSEDQEALDDEIRCEIIMITQRKDWQM